MFIYSEYPYRKDSRLYNIRIPNRQILVKGTTIPENFIKSLEGLNSHEHFCYFYFMYGIICRLPQSNMSVCFHLYKNPPILGLDFCEMLLIWNYWLVLSF